MSNADTSEIQKKAKATKAYDVAVMRDAARKFTEKVRLTRDEIQSLDEDLAEVTFGSVVAYLSMLADHCYEMAENLEEVTRRVQLTPEEQAIEDRGGMCISGGRPDRIMGGGLDVSLKASREVAEAMHTAGVSFVDLWKLLVEAVRDDPGSDIYDLTEGVVGCFSETYDVVAKLVSDDQKVWYIHVKESISTASK